MVCGLYLNKAGFLKSHKEEHLERKSEQELQVIWKKVFRLGLSQGSFISFPQTNKPLSYS